jgi:hypothetical protein
MKNVNDGLPVITGESRAVTYQNQSELNDRLDRVEQSDREKEVVIIGGGAFYGIHTGLRIKNVAMKRQSDHRRTRSELSVRPEIGGGAKI